MSRLASGSDEIVLSAREAIARAKTVEQLRQAQAVLLPLVCGMSLDHTAQAICVSPGWACQLRRLFMQGKIAGAPDAPARGGRNRQNMSIAQEREFLQPFLKQAATGGVLVVGETRLRWTSGWAALLHGPRRTTCCTVTVGESSRLTNDIRKATRKRKPSRKKLLQKLAQIRQNWAQGQAVKLMFQDEARFGRISDVRRC